MIIRIMRHGDAPFISGERALSDLGSQESKAMGAWLSQLNEIQSIERLLVSPLLRAQQTADCIQAGQADSMRRDIEPLLLPETDPALCAEYLISLNLDSVLVISHMPLVANLLAYFDPKGSRYFPTASIATVNLNDGFKVIKVDFMTPQEL